MVNARQQLPAFPNPDNLRKQAKARLAKMRAHAPGARLTEAQLVLAREYGFPTWAALQGEASRRANSPAGAWGRIRRAPSGVLPFWHAPEVEADEQHLQGFLRGGVVMPLGVLLALVGLALVLVSVHHGLALGHPPVTHRWAP
jgi:hypothetical protein